MAHEPPARIAAIVSRSGLRGDIARLMSAGGTHEGRPTIGRAIQRVLTRPGPLAIVLYRASHKLWTRGLETPAELLWRLNYFLTGADIHPGAEIAGGLRLTHTTGLVIGKGARIGANVTLLHGVTLGGSSRGFFADDSERPDGFPTIGEGSKIAAGAKLLGPITIGRECFVGANAVVAKDLPDGTVFNPGREVADLRTRVEELERELLELKEALSRQESQPSS
ncbi:MAG TPA: serine O-acetyltransferase [Actinomycetota bacterium]